MNDIKSKKLVYSAIGIALLLIMVVGVTYSFFNYTRTGSENILAVGRINFTSNSSTTINLTDTYPVNRSDIDNNINVGSVTITINGDTTYDDGIEYLVSAVNVVNTINDKTIPVGISITASNLGTNSNTYWSSRGGNTSLYKVLSGLNITDDKELMVGYITKGSTGVNGNITIKAFIDEDKVSVGNVLDGDKVLLSLEEWNSLHTGGLSFKLKVEANEGLWVGKLDACPDCMFMYEAGRRMLAVWTGDPNPTVLNSGLSESYLEVVENSGKDYFLGLILNSDNQVVRGYVCGIKNGNKFCIEGNGTGSLYEANRQIMQRPNLYNNTCVEYLRINTGKRYDYVKCGPWDNSGSLSVEMNSLGTVSAGISSSEHCAIGYGGTFECYED